MAEVKISHAQNDMTEPGIANASYMKMYTKLQYLQEEIFRLQGVIDKQQHELDILKKQHKEDIISLDKRLRNTGVQVLDAGKAAGQTTMDSAARASVPSSETEKKKPRVSTSSNTVAKEATVASDSYSRYKQAYSLIKSRRFDEAKNAFSRFIADYPDDKLVANCYYWLGELYILDNDPGKAEAAFNTVVENFPEHNKKPEAMYKLGRLYFDAGKKEQARKQMQSILDQYQGKSINAVRIANDFLKANY